MSKKFYEAPELEVILIQMEGQVLTGSPTTGDDNWDPDGGDPAPYIDLGE